MSTEIGIDVGYSKSKATCGLAVTMSAGSSIKTWPSGGRTWTSSGRRTILCTMMGLDALIALMPNLVQANQGDMTIVIDGPLGPGGPPTAQRHIDRECQRGEFQRRAVPASVTGGGRALVDATCRIIDALVSTRSGSQFRFSATRASGELPLQIFETMPTIGLAVLLPMVPQNELNTIPSRSNPVGGVSQKSDFYWARGAAARVAGMLGCPDVADDADHDRRSALYCLAVAVQIASASPHAPVCIGAPSTGTYVLAGHEDRTWTTELARVGRIS